MSDTKTATVKVGANEFVVRRPKYIEWRAFKGGIASTNSSGEGVATINAIEDLAKACCTSHTAEQLEALVEDNLDLFESLAAVITRLAGLGESERASKSR